MATHVKVIAAFYVAIGVMLVMGALFSQMLMALLASIVTASHEENAAVGASVLGFAGVALSVMLVVFAAPFLVAGWGLLKFRPWSRILGIILAAMCLINVPFGTLLGAYALVILFRKDTEALFAARRPGL